VLNDEEMEFYTEDRRKKEKDNYFDDDPYENFGESTGEEETKGEIEDETE